MHIKRLESLCALSLSYTYRSLGTIPMPIVYILEGREICNKIPASSKHRILINTKLSISCGHIGIVRVFCCIIFSLSNREGIVRADKDDKY